MSDEVETSRSELRQRTERIVHQARQQATYAEVALRHAKKDDPLQKQIKESREALISVGEQIDALKAKIDAEREPARESLAQAQQAVIEAESEVERLMRQIEKKERETDGLSQMKSRKDTVLGDIVVPDPEAKARASALRAEVAGFYTALGTAKGALADAVQARDELETETVYMPVEADPRMAELYRNLEAETTALSLLQGQVLGGPDTPPSSLFTNEETNKITVLAAETIKTALPDFVEASVFRDVVQKLEAALRKYVPAEVLGLMRDSRGITKDSKGLATRLTSTLDRAVDLPMLDDKQKTAFLRIVVPAVVEAMEDGKTLDAVLEAVTTKPSRKKPAKSTKEKSPREPVRRGNKKVSVKAREP